MKNPEYHYSGFFIYFIRKYYGAFLKESIQIKVITY